MEARDILLVDKCLSRGANILWQNHSGEFRAKTCVHYAAERGCVEVLKRLLNEGEREVMHMQV